MKQYFEQVPLSLVKKRIATHVAVTARTAPVLCAICDAPVQLEHCKIDEDGEAVHDKCYLASLAKSPGTRNGRTSKR